MKPDLLKKQIKMGIAIYPARFPVKRSTQGRLWYACLWSLPSSCSQSSTEWLWNTNKVASLITDRGAALPFKEVGQYSHEISLPPLQYLLPAQSISGKLFKSLFLLLAINRGEGKERNPARASHVGQGGHTGTSSWHPFKKSSKTEIVESQNPRMV